MKIVKKLYCNWDDQTKQRLKYATFASGGYLRYFIRAFPRSPTIVIFGEKQIMGWAFALRNTHNNTVFVNLFVNERYRHRGLGTFLVEEALKDFDVISLSGWSTGTQRLFRKIQRKHPGRIKVFDWWKNDFKYDKLIDEALKVA